MDDPKNKSLPSKNQLLKASQDSSSKNTLASLTTKRSGIGSGFSPAMGSATGMGAKFVTGSSSRLPSFKGLRDLTLSAPASSLPLKPQTTRTKKVFTPNLVVRREKGDKFTESKSEKTAKKFAPKVNFASRGRGRGREKEFVQTRGSLFGEGIAAAPLKRGYGSSYGGGGGAGGGGGGGGGSSGDNVFMQKPVLNPAAAYNIDKDVEDMKLKEIMGYDFIDDPNDEETDVIPIQLPLITMGSESFKAKEEERGKNLIKKLKLDYSEVPSLGNIKIKEEPCDIVDSLDEQLRNTNIETSKKNANIAGIAELPKQSEVSEILSDTNSDVIFFQLPSCLPGHPPEVIVPPITDSNKEQEKQKRKLCTLETLPEGQIGTLKIYKSGRTELWLGKHKLEINNGTPVGFIQHLVKIETEAEKKTGSISALGQIKHRLVCTPDFESLVSH